jgi:hypothetical protein
MKRNDTPDDGGRASPASGPTRAEDRAQQLFVRRLCQALDDAAGALPAATLERLALARKAALRAQPVPQLRMAPAAQFASPGLGGSSTRLGFGRASLVFTSIVLVGACLAGLYRVEQDRRIEDLADVDTAVLNDDLPISAYADHGFNAFIKQNP